jgi:glyceraldehyde 3-phosphate dehydrogenase
VDCVFEMKREVTVEEVNQFLTDASKGDLQDILAVETKPLVSADFVHDPRSGPLPHSFSYLTLARSIFELMLPSFLPSSCNASLVGIVDALSTMVVNGTSLKVFVWYDNEWGYVNRMVEIANKVASSHRSKSKL